MAGTPPTHFTEDPAVTHHGKRFYLIDDARHIFAADLTYDEAQRAKDQVAGRSWSRTPRWVEMPKDAEQAKKIRSRAYFGNPADKKAAGNGNQHQVSQSAQDEQMERLVRDAAEKAVAEAKAAAPEEEEISHLENEAAEDILGDGDLDELDA